MKPICELYALKMQIKHNNFHSKIQSQITATISQILLEEQFLRAKAFKIPKIVIGKKNPKKHFLVSHLQEGDKVLDFINPYQ